MVSGPKKWNLGEHCEEEEGDKKVRNLFTYLTMTNSSFTRSARALFAFVYFTAVLVHSTSLNDLLCSQVDGVIT